MKDLMDWTRKGFGDTKLGNSLREQAETVQKAIIKGLLTPYTRRGWRFHKNRLYTGHEDPQVNQIKFTHAFKVRIADDLKALINFNYSHAGWSPTWDSDREGQTLTVRVPVHRGDPPPM